MFATKLLRAAAAHAERTPSIKFIGKRSIPSSIDHTPRAHPASPTHALPADFPSTHQTFSEYRQRSQQYGPLRKTLHRGANAGGIGGAPAVTLGSIEAGKGVFFDRDELPARFRRSSWSVEEIELVESGGASLAA